MKITKLIKTDGNYCYNAMGERFVAVDTIKLPTYAVVGWGEFRSATRKVVGNIIIGVFDTIEQAVFRKEEIESWEQDESWEY